MTSLDKEKIETSLLKAMKGIDEAVAIIWDANEKVNNAQRLSDIKAQIKKILNSDYDQCARNRLAH